MRPALAVLVGVIASASMLASQSAFVDDAGRTVVIPAAAARVFAAGAPAEVLLYTLAPDKLVGRNRVPQGDAVEFFPPAFRDPVFIRQLPEVDNPAADAEFVAARPDLYIDYGTVHDDYVAVLDAVRSRTGVPGILLDGGLARIPATYRRLGAALGISQRGEQLAGAAAALMDKYRGALSRGAPVRVYLACSADGFQPCLADQSAGEQLAWLGGVNVAGMRTSAPRRPLTIDEIRAMAPEAIVVAGAAGSAARLRADPQWQPVAVVAAGRVYEWPGLPYSWGPRPPSVNRLPGVAWLAYVAAGRPFDDAFAIDVKTFYRDFYHLEPTDAQLQRLLRP